MHTHTHTYTNTHTYTHAHTHYCLYVTIIKLNISRQTLYHFRITYSDIFIYAYAHTHTYIHKHKHTYIYTCTSTLLFICNYYINYIYQDKSIGARPYGFKNLSPSKITPTVTQQLTKSTDFLQNYVCVTAPSLVLLDGDALDLTELVEVLLQLRVCGGGIQVAHEHASHDFLLGITWLHPRTLHGSAALNY